MRKKLPWMKIGAAVMAGEQQGVITGMEENTIDGVDYVYYISVRIGKQRRSGTYHPGDVIELTTS